MNPIPYSNRYEILSAVHPAGLATLVNEKLDKGGILVGGVQLNGGIFYQAVARPGLLRPKRSCPAIVEAEAAFPAWKIVASKIGAFYLQKHNMDYDKTAAAIECLRISKVEVAGNAVSITTARPGILIGPRGKNVDALTAYLGMEVKIIEDRDPLLEYLIPEPPEPTDAYDKEMDDLYDQFEGGSQDGEEAKETR